MKSVLYTVRNDDYHTFRCGDPGFLIKYIKGMKKPYVHGFYWGATDIYGVWIFNTWTLSIKHGNMILKTLVPV